MSDAKHAHSGNGAAAQRLRIVAAEHELPGHAPLLYERLTKTARPGSPEHRGVLAVAHALARQAATRTLAPSARKHLEPALLVLESFVTGPSSPARSSNVARDARAAAFAALPVMEAQTLEAVERAAGTLLTGKETALHDHARHTVRRFVALSVHHATTAVCHALDAIDAPDSAIHVPSDACGALAYSRTALGSARSPEFQAAAIEQARWEHERQSDASTPLAAFEVQIFHEYLGARWRSHGDQERHLTSQFVAWALGPLTPR